MLDPRRNAFRPDLADARLRGIVIAERYVEGAARVVCVPSIDLHGKPKVDEPATTEALYGEDVLVFEETKDWAWVQLKADGYVGYMAREALAAPRMVHTHRVETLWGLGFKAPDIKSPLRMVLPMGARVTGVPEGEFLKLAEGFFMPRQHAVPAGAAASKDFVATAERLLGAPYRWGGRTALGIDCSGLIQMALLAAGIPAPRDSGMQAEELGFGLDTTNPGPLRRGDLVCWRGHIGIMSGPEHLIHANAHHMAVVQEPLADAIGRSLARGSPMTAIRRLSPVDNFP